MAGCWISSKSLDSKGWWARLLVYLLTPVASAVKSEVNVPVVRNFVNTSFPYLIDLYKRRRNAIEALPLATILLAFSTREGIDVYIYLS